MRASGCGTRPVPSQAHLPPLSLEDRLRLHKSRLEWTWSLKKVVVIKGIPDAAKMPPVSLSFLQKPTLEVGVCPDTSLTAQTSLTGREALTLPALWSPNGAALHTLHWAHGDPLTCLRIGDSSKPPSPIRQGQRHE